jgi:hypothetical protein
MSYMHLSRKCLTELTFPLQSDLQIDLDLGTSWQDRQK